MCILYNSLTWTIFKFWTNPLYITFILSKLLQIEMKVQNIQAFFSKLTLYVYFWVVWPLLSNETLGNIKECPHIPSPLFSAKRHEKENSFSSMKQSKWLILTNFWALIQSHHSWLLSEAAPVQRCITFQLFEKKKKKFESLLNLSSCKTWTQFWWAFGLVFPWINPWNIQMNF